MKKGGPRSDQGAPGKRFALFLAGTPSNTRERTLIELEVRHRLMTFAHRDKTRDVLRKWGHRPRPQ